MLTGSLGAFHALESDRTGEQASVLIVDDEHTERYARWLCEYRVRTASDGDGALEAVSGAVDVVLLARELPDCSAEEVLDGIRERGLDCRAALLAGAEPADDIVERGFDDCLTDPIDGRAIRRTVRRLLELRAHAILLEEHYTLASTIAALETNAVKRGSNGECRRLRGRLDEVERALDEQFVRLKHGEGGAWIFRRVLRDASAANGGPPSPSGSAGD